MTKVPEGMSNLTSAFQTSAHIVWANGPLAKANEKLKPKVQGGEVYCTPRKALLGYRYTIL